MSDQVSVDLYVFDRERVSGMGEGEHTAPILSKYWVKGVISVSELRAIKETSKYFYRLEDGTPYGPGLFAVYEDLGWRKTYFMIEPDADID